MHCSSRARIDGIAVDKGDHGRGVVGASGDRGPTRRQGKDFLHREGGAAAQRATAETSSGGTGN